MEDVLYTTVPQPRYQVVNPCPPSPAVLFASFSRGSALAVVVFVEFEQPPANTQEFKSLVTVMALKRSLQIGTLPNFEVSLKGLSQSLVFTTLRFGNDLLPVLLDWSFESAVDLVNGEQ